MLSPFKNLKFVKIMASFSIFLSILEFVIPKPIPFFKFGFANIPILLSLGILAPLDFILLLFLKVIGAGIFSGTIYSWTFLLSFFGSIISGILVYIIYSLFKNIFSLIGLSIFGALFNNYIQIYIASLFLGESIHFLSPILLSIGLVSSSIIGYLCLKFKKESKWLKIYT